MTSTTSPLAPCASCNHTYQDHYAEFCAACPSSNTNQSHNFRSQRSQALAERHDLIHRAVEALRVPLPPEIFFVLYDLLNEVREAPLRVPDDPAA